MIVNTTDILIPLSPVTKYNTRVRLCIDTESANANLSVRFKAVRQ